MKLLIVAGARPNFMKIAPLCRALDNHNRSATTRNRLDYILAHTGQHYDHRMSQVFFNDLGLPRPDVHLDIGSGTHAVQTAKALTGLEQVMLDSKPELTVVVGDVNSTLAAALASAKLGIPVAHVEAGIRSYDRAMPEEINRLLTDHLSQYLFTTTIDDDRNLKKEGFPAQSIFRVGNIMADSLYYYVNRSLKSSILSQLGLKKGNYALLTLHRPANVDNRQNLAGILGAVTEVSRDIPVIFPVHPRTAKMMKQYRLHSSIRNSRIATIEPLGYPDFLDVEKNARFVITDSGGIQVETMLLKVPCLTLLDSPVWQITHRYGANRLVGSSGSSLAGEVSSVMAANALRIRRPPLWDGKTAERIVKIIAGHGKMPKKSSAGEVRQ